MSEKIDALRKQLTENVSKRSDLYSQLDRSFALESFIPDVFRAGQVRIHVPKDVIHPSHLDALVRANKVNRKYMPRGR